MKPVHQFFSPYEKSLGVAPVEPKTVQIFRDTEQIDFKVGRQFASSGQTAVLSRWHATGTHRLRFSQFPVHTNDYF